MLWTSILVIKIGKLFFRLFLPLRYSGLEKLPQERLSFFAPTTSLFSMVRF